MRKGKPQFEVAHILQKHHHQIPKLTANSWQARTLYAIAACRTSVLGGAWSVIRDFALGRYTHKVAISNHRIIDIAGENVTFSAKDYRHGNRKITIRMNQKEFIRRFALHILPKGFVRMRHYGILCSSKKGDIIPELQKILGKPELHLSPVEIAHRICPVCRKGTMMTVMVFSGRGSDNSYHPPISQKLISIPIG